MNPSIVVITYNRPKSLTRLLSFVDRAVYDNQNIELVISIDYQDSEAHNEVVRIAQQFEWAHGNKKVIVHEANLGLRKHVISCGNLVENYDSLIMLEDDLVVSPHFYLYAQKALEYYANDKNIGGISLYSHRHNYCADLPFDLIPDSNDVYFMQIAASWGQAWTKSQWQGFAEWYGTGPVMGSEDNIPEKIKNWPESSWVKYFIKYLVNTDKHFAYPKRSFTSNMSDAGTHHKSKEYTYSVPFFYDFNPHNIQFVNFDESINVYDSYFELDARQLKKLKLPISDVEISTIDTYGIKDLSFHTGNYVISSKQLLNREYKKSYDIDLKPAALNILYGVVGEVLFLSKAENFDNSSKLEFTEIDWDYYYGKKRIRDYLNILWIKVKKKYLK